MRTILVLDERLLEEVRVLSGARTKKAAVEAALRDFVRRRMAKNFSPSKEPWILPERWMI